MTDDKQTDFAKGYDTALQDTYEWMDVTTREWYALKIVNAGQMLALKDLVHEMRMRL